MSNNKNEFVYYVKRYDEETDTVDVLGTVYLIKNEEGIWSRGISVRNYIDKFVKKIGRGIAYKRALSAMKTKECEQFKCYNGYELMDSVTPFIEQITLDNKEDNISVITEEFEWKQCYDAELTTYEKRIVTNPYEKS